MKNRLTVIFLFPILLIMNACNDEEPMAPITTATPTSQIINSGTATSVSLTSDIQGTTFTWTVVQNGVTGATDGSGSNIAQTLTVTSLAAGTATYTVTPVNNGVEGAAITIIITVSPLKITYVANVKPLFVASCTPCHVTGGSNYNKWDQYAQAKAKIAVILDRVQRTPGTFGFMPEGRTKLPDESIAILKKWLEYGLLEN